MIMDELTLIKRNGERIELFSKVPFCTVRSATQNTALMGDDTVTLNIISTEVISIVKGDKIYIGDDEYTVRTVVQREKISEIYYSYDVTFYGVIYELMKSIFRNCDEQGRSDKSTFDLTYSLKDIIKVVIYNVSRDYPGLWAFDADNCPDTEPITLSFARQNCLQVLQSSCSKFGYDFRITQQNGVRTIHIGKFGDRVVPPGGLEYFEWGRGGGLYKLKEEKIDDKAIITRLWIEGGTSNIRSDYRNYSERLQLPYPKRLNRNAHTLKDGTRIAAGSEMIGIDDDTKRYMEDAALAEKIGSEEDAEEYPNVFPKRTGRVTALVDGDINAFIDDTMDFDLCEADSNGTKYLIGETAAKITFISGKLAGQQFELPKKGGYVHTSRKFTLIPFTNERGLTIPTVSNEAMRISVGDLYKITDINLPASYEENAEEDLWYAGLETFKERTQARAKYTLTLDRMYFLDNTPSDAEVCIFNIGDYVPVKDERFGIKKLIRIQKVSRNLLLRQDYSLTLSDITAISVMSQTILDVIEHNKIIEANNLRDLTKAKRGWRTTEELRNMVYDTDGYFDPENIRPNSIDTNMLTVGSKSQQFILNGVVMEANVSGMPNRFNASAGTLSHLTIEEDGVRNWNMAAAEFTLAAESGYYLFARCPKNGNSGTWYMTQEQLKFEPDSDPNNYYFQVGILSSVYPEKFRDFVTTYGFTRINGNTITTGRIVTSDGKCWIDLDENSMRVGDDSSSIDWNVTRKNAITLRNVQVISGSGEAANLGVYRGTYNKNLYYYTNDEVSYTDADGETCTYRYIYPTQSKGVEPTNSTYWAIVAQGKTGTPGTPGAPGDPGAPGKDGNSSFFTFHDSAAKPATPTGGGASGGWHTDSTDSVVWMSVKTAASILEGTWGAPIRVKGADGHSLTAKGQKVSVSDLPMTGNTIGDAYTVNGILYVWTGATWQNMGSFRGEDGKSSYLHQKFSNDGGATFTDGNGETPGRWMGTLVDQNQQDSDNPKAYKWVDTKGEQGVPGEPGEDGRPCYLHIKYSDNGGLSFTANNGEDPGDYIGSYTDDQELDSDDPARYTWALIKGGSGASGTDASAGDYYEFRYAKNGSTITAPTLDRTDPNPDGWSIIMPTPGTLEYVWEIVGIKSGITDKTRLHIPINAADTGGRLTDTSGNGHDGLLGAGFIVSDAARGYCLKLSDDGDARIPYDLPFGRNFTLCFWMKTERAKFTWMLNGENGREYVEKDVDVSANTWYHFAFRFSGRTVCVFQNGQLLHNESLNTTPSGFSMYDDNLFGTTVHFDDVRVLEGAFPEADIVAVMNGTADKMVQNWSVPVRITPYDGKDGKDGKSPVLVYRGIYDSTKTYYGTDTRVEAVKYNNVYYITRIDAGVFSGIAPTDTAKWNTFGAQFETIATNLLLSEGANIGDWFMSGGKIVSTLGTGNKITLDASMALILVESAKAGGDHSTWDGGIGSKIKIDAMNGVVEARGVTNASRVAYMSPTGLFANFAGTDGMPASSGYSHRGAIVGLGFGNVDKNTWSLTGLETIIAGVYGRASNSGTADAYGGFFYSLFAAGLVLNRKPITGTSDNTTYLSDGDTFVIGYNSAVSTVYLPSSPKEGQVVFTKQWWHGTMRVRPYGTHKIYDDSSENQYYDFSEGWAGIFVFTKSVITSGSTTKNVSAWIVSRFKY